MLPLRFSGGDSSLRPLERGLAELLTTDLARSTQITVLERARIQAVLDELALQQSGQTDSATNVRAGRILRAGRLVQGSILQLDESQLRVDAAVVDVPTTRVRGVAHDSDELEQLFALEKRIALELFDELGVTLTVAERNAIEQRPTRSLAAFLAYSRGLTAEDEGRYDDASSFYRDAIRLDPGFGEALQKDRDVRGLVTGGRLTTRAIESRPRRGPPRSRPGPRKRAARRPTRRTQPPTTSIRRRRARPPRRDAAASTVLRRRIPRPPPPRPTSLARMAARR